MDWGVELAFRIAPKSGPLRVMNTLLDANRAIMQDLPKGHLKRAPLWRAAGWAVYRAAQTGATDDIAAATDCIVAALESEGWLTRSREAPSAVRLNVAMRSMEDALRECMIAAANAGPRKPALTLIRGSGRAMDKAAGLRIDGAAGRRVG